MNCKDAQKLAELIKDHLKSYLWWQGIEVVQEKEIWKVVVLINNDFGWFITDEELIKITSSFVEQKYLRYIRSMQIATINPS